MYIEYDRPKYPRRAFRQHLGAVPQDFAIIVVPNEEMKENYKNHVHGEGSTIKEEKDKFQVNVDVQHFAPEEITVKTADGFLIVEAKHEERQDDHGFVSRSFVRRYPLPEGVEGDCVTSRLSSDGVLSITAPLKVQKNSNERIVPIVQTGPVRKQVGGKEE